MADLFRRRAMFVDFQSPILLGQSLRMLGRIEEAQTADQEGVGRAEHTLVLNPLDGPALSLGSAALRDDRRFAKLLARLRCQMIVGP